MDNRYLSIKYLQRKLKLSRFLVFCLVFIVGIIVNNASVFASTYGEGNYGDRLYGEDFPASSPASAQTCNDTAPKSAPTITLATAKSSTQILLTFSHATDPVTYYALEYGPEHQKYIYSATNIGGSDTTTYTVTSLSPDSTYYFRLRAGNGCMPGEWSTELSTKTLSRFAKKTLNFVKTEITPVDIATPSATSKPGKTEITTENGYEVNVNVVNTNNEPVAGAKVTIHSEPRETVTDLNGVAHFTGIEAGTHTLQIAYGDYSGEESIVLNASVKQFKITVTVEQKNNPVFSTPALAIIGALIGALVILLIFVVLRSRRASK